MKCEHAGCTEDATWRAERAEYALVGDPYKGWCDDHKPEADDFGYAVAIVAVPPP